MPAFTTAHGTPHAVWLVAALLAISCCLLTYHHYISLLVRASPPTCSHPLCFPSSFTRSCICARSSHAVSWIHGSADPYPLLLSRFQKSSTHKPHRRPGVFMLSPTLRSYSIRRASCRVAHDVTRTSHESVVVRKEQCW
jgi:hypothetical protein